MLGSCKERGVNPREWLNDVIGQLPYYLAPKSDKGLKELLPDVWRKQSRQLWEKQRERKGLTLKNNPEIS